MAFVIRSPKYSSFEIKNKNDSPIEKDKEHFDGELGVSDQRIHHQNCNYNHNHNHNHNHKHKQQNILPHTNNSNQNLKNKSTDSSIVNYRKLLGNHQSLTNNITTNPSIPTRQKKFKQVQVEIDRKSMVYDFRTLKKYKLGNFNQNKSCGVIMEEDRQKIQSIWKKQNDGNVVNKNNSIDKNQVLVYGKNKNILTECYELPGSLSKKTMVKYMQQYNKQNIYNINKSKQQKIPGPGSYNPIKPTPKTHSPVFRPSIYPEQNAQIFRNRQKDQEICQQQQNLFAVKYQCMNSSSFKKLLSSSSNLVNISNRMLREKLFWGKENNNNRESRNSYQQQRQRQPKIQTPQQKINNNKNTDNNQDVILKQQFQNVIQNQPGPAQYNLQHHNKNRNNGVLFGNTQRFVNTKSNVNLNVGGGGCQQICKNQFSSQQKSDSQKQQKSFFINNDTNNNNSNTNNNTSISTNNNNDKNSDYHHESSMFCSQSQRFNSNIPIDSPKLQYTNTQNSMLKQTKNRKKQINFGSSSPKNTNNGLMDIIDARPYYCVQKKLVKKQFMGKFDISQGRRQLFDIRHVLESPGPNIYNVEPNWIKEHSCILHQDAKTMPNEQKQNKSIHKNVDSKNTTFFLCSQTNLQKQSQNQTLKSKGSLKHGKLTSSLNQSSSLSKYQQVKKNTLPSSQQQKSSKLRTDSLAILQKQDIALWGQWEKKSFNTLFAKEPIPGNNPIQNKLL